MKGHLMQDQRYAARAADIPVPVKIDETQKDRKSRRANGERGSKRISKGWPQAPSRSRTGTPQHFRFWMADLSLRSALQKTKTAALAQALGDADQVGIAMAYAILATDRRYRNVWQVSQASRQDLLAVKGIGPKRLETLHADLLARRVNPKWSA